MCTSKEVAQELVRDAMQTKTQTTADMLIELAYKYDDGINVDAYKAIWLEGWLEDNKNRMRHDGQDTL